MFRENWRDMFRNEAMIAPVNAPQPVTERFCAPNSTNNPATIATNTKAKWPMFMMAGIRMLP